MSTDGRSFAAAARASCTGWAAKAAVRDRLAVVPADPAPEPFPIGLCVRRADLRRPLVAALWSLTRG